MKYFNINIKPANALKADRNTLYLLYGTYYNKETMTQEKFFLYSVADYLNGKTELTVVNAEEKQALPFNSCTFGFGSFSGGSKPIMWDDEDVTIDTSKLPNSIWTEVVTLKKGHCYAMHIADSKSGYTILDGENEQIIYAQFEHLADMVYQGADIPRYGQWFLPIAFLSTVSDEAIKYWQDSNQIYGSYRIFNSNGYINKAFTTKMWNCAYAHMISYDNTYSYNPDFTDQMNSKYGYGLTSDPVLSKGDVFKYTGADLDNLTNFDSAFTEEMIANVKQFKRNHYYRVTDFKNCGNNTSSSTTYAVLMVFFEDVTEEYIKKDKVWDFMINVDTSKEAGSYYDNLLSAIGDNEGRWGHNCDDDGNAICIDYGKGWHTTQPDSITKAVERLVTEYKPYMYSV